MRSLSEIPWFKVGAIFNYLRELRDMEGGTIPISATIRPDCVKSAVGKMRELIKNADNIPYLDTNDNVNLGMSAIQPMRDNQNHLFVPIEALREGDEPLLNPEEVTQVAQTLKGGYRAYSNPAMIVEYL